MRSGSTLHRWLFGAALLIAAAAMVWPGPMLFTERIEPTVMGLPFALAWNVGWLGFVFFALVLFHLATGERG